MATIEEINILLDERDLKEREKKHIKETNKTSFYSGLLVGFVVSFIMWCFGNLF